MPKCSVQAATKYRPVADSAKRKKPLRCSWVGHESWMRSVRLEPQSKVCPDCDCEIDCFVREATVGSSRSHRRVGAGNCEHVGHGPSRSRPIRAFPAE